MEYDWIEATIAKYPYDIYGVYNDWEEDDIVPISKLGRIQI